MGHGSWVMGHLGHINRWVSWVMGHVLGHWVMGHACNGSDGLWVTVSDPWSTLHYTTQADKNIHIFFLGIKFKIIYSMFLISGLGSSTFEST